MRKIILAVFFMLILVLGNCEKLYESTDVTSEMMDCISETCYKDMYPLYSMDGEQTIRNIGMSFKETKFTYELLNQLTDSVLFSKLYIDKAIKQIDSDNYIVYIQNKGICIHFSILKELWENGKLFINDGIEQYIDETTIEGDLNDKSEYFADYIFNHNISFNLKKVKGKFKCVSVDEYEPNQNNMSYNKELKKINELSFDAYVEYFRNMMAETIIGKNKIDNSIIFKEKTS